MRGGREERGAEGWASRARLLATMLCLVCCGIGISLVAAGRSWAASGTAYVMLHTQSTGAGGTFSYRVTGHAAPFTTTTDSPALFIPVATGSTVTIEMAPNAGFEIDMLDCHRIGPAPPVLDPAARRAQIPIPAWADDAVVQCLFRVAPVGPKGSITVVTEALGFGYYGYVLDGPVADSIGHRNTTPAPSTMSNTLSSRATGSYTLRQTERPAEHRLHTVTCTGDSGGVPTTVDPDNATATIGLDENEHVTCRFVHRLRVEDKQRTIARFMTDRGQAIVSTLPGLSRGLQRLGTPPAGGTSGGTGTGFRFDGQADGEGSRFSFGGSLSEFINARRRQTLAAPLGDPLSFAGGGTSRGLLGATGFDIWTEGQYWSFDARPGASRREGSFGVAAIGADLRLSPALMVGAIAQIDWTDQESRDLASSASGRGWLAGPTLDLKLSEKLFFHARAQWGRSDNEVVLGADPADRFETRRRLAMVQLTGQFVHGAWRVRPRAQGVMFDEESEAFVDAGGLLIPGQQIRLRRFSAGPEIGYAMRWSDRAEVEPFVAVYADWNSGSAAPVAVAGETFGPDGASLRFEGGLGIAMDGFRLDASGALVGAGSDEFRAFGGQLRASVRLD